MEELKVGELIKERYSLVRFLGSGSFGEVWLAHDIYTNRDVALKIYLTLDPAGVEEFQCEYSNTIDLSNPYLLTPEHFDVYNRRPFLVMKYCEQGSSSKLSGHISEDQLWKFIQDVSQGLDALHSQADPIVHQDIKPDNILIDSNGRFLINDFGISKKLRATMRRQSQRDVSSGAMPYMAPERFESRPRLETKSDVWSLGASIYELATGELPFSGFGGAMQRNGAEMPDLGSKYSSQLNLLMQRCLAANLQQRPTAKEIVQWAKTKSIPLSTKTINNQGIPNTIQTPRTTVVENQKSGTKNNSFLILLGIIIIVGIAIAFWYNNSSSSENNQLEDTTQNESINDLNNINGLNTPQDLVLSSSSIIINGYNCHFYKGAFYYKNDIYPVMVAFLFNNNKIERVIYKNVTYGGRIPMSYLSLGNEIILSGKDGNNVFTISLKTEGQDRLVGTAVDGNKSMTVRLMPTTETFSFTLSNISEQKESTQYNITYIANAFISKYSDGATPWTCLNSTSIKRLSQDLEIDKSPGGIYMAIYSAPFTINGIPIIKNQLDNPEDWEIYLRGPNSGATSLLMSAMPQYVELEDIVQKIAKAFNATLQNKKTSDYGRDCVYIYSLSKLKMAIFCSFGAHGGSIDVLFGSSDIINEYINELL